MSRHDAGAAAQLDHLARTSGRHRKPSSPGPATAIITTGAFALIPLALPTAHASAAEIAPTTGLDAIATCESGGNPHAQNASSTASGLYQFLDSSWKAYGGSKYGSRAKDATPAQQTEIATSAVARSGLTPWAASQHCWGGKTSTAALTSPRHATARHLTAEPVVKRAAATRRRPVSAAKPTRHAARAARHLASRSRRSDSAGHSGTDSHRVHPGVSRSRIVKSQRMSGQTVWESHEQPVRHTPNHHHLHPGEALLTLPRATDLAHNGHSVTTVAR